MAGLQGWMSRETWDIVCLTWQIFPIIIAIRHLLPGNSVEASTLSRTSPPSTFQSYLVSTLTSLPSALIILYCTITSPSRPLPVGNWTMVVLYTVSSIYRAFLSTAPWTLKLDLNARSLARSDVLEAVIAQILCGIALGGWLGGYGKNSEEEWSGMVYSVEVGLVTWGWALLAMILHEDELRPWMEHNSQLVVDGAVSEEKQRQQEQEQRDGQEQRPEPPKLPRSYLFKYMLYPHFLFSLIMWAGFWIIGGRGCEPARLILVYEFSTTVTRALRSRRECVRVFGVEEVERRWVLVPGIF